MTESATPAGYKPSRGPWLVPREQQAQMAADCSAMADATDGRDLWLTVMLRRRARFWQELADTT